MVVTSKSAGVRQGKRLTTAQAAKSGGSDAPKKYSSSGSSSGLMSGVTAPLGSSDRTAQLMDASNKALSSKPIGGKVGDLGLQEPKLPGSLEPMQEVPEVNPPTPTPVPPTTPPVSYEQAQKNLQAGGLQGDELAQAETTLKSKYQTGLQDAQTSGLPVPDSMGGARGFIEATVPAGPDTTVVDTVFQEDPFFKEITDAWEEYNSPKQQRESLTKTYKEMVKASGIEELDTELMNMKNVIDGTEDDIRNEVTKAGGFATDSQVAALTNSRNKQLIKNYNNLLETRNIQQQHLDKMIELTEKDRQMADQRLDRMFNIGFQMLNYRDKMQENARNSYQKIVDKVGYNGLLQAAGGDPYYTNLVEKSLGLTSGSLAQLATIKDEGKELNLELKREQIKTEQAQRSNIYSQIEERNKGTDNVYGTLDGKPQNVSQSSANSYANRLNEANVTISNLGSNFTGKLSMLPALNFMKSGDRQAYEQAQSNFITAVLRRESGASIAPTEFETARTQYFPQPGDKAEVVKQKEKTRNTVINNFYKEANVLRPVLPGMIIESDGKKYKVGVDGETLTEVK